MHNRGDERRRFLNTYRVERFVSIGPISGNRNRSRCQRLHLIGSSDFEGHRLALALGDDIQQFRFSRDIFAVDLDDAIADFYSCQ